MAPLTNAQWLLAARPQGEIRESDFEYREVPVPQLEEGEFRVRNIYLSLDPTNRIWMNDAASYLPKLELGEVMRGITLGVVEESRNPGFSSGEHVTGLLGWQRYTVSDATGVAKLPPIPLPLTAHHGLLGHIGFTAYWGLIDIGKPNPGETLVVSAAAGAVGSLAAQIGKILGMRVVGIAGSEEKCRWLREDLGLDGAINYRTENVAKALSQNCPDGIDVYFENVGGEILEAVLSQINLKARIVVCGLISQYNAQTPPPGPRNLGMILMRRARMEGFIVTDYLNRSQEAAMKLVGWALEGKLKYRIDLVQGLENAPSALKRLFTGGNQGKLLVQVSPES